ncbi:aromatic ring-opening dioxygenase [Seiridium cupressi]
MPSVIEPTKPFPVYFIGHAGVGLLFQQAPNFDTIRNDLRGVGKEILAIKPRPKAIVVFSGHFEAGEIHGPEVIEVNVKKNTYIQHDFVNDFHDSKPFVYDYNWPHQDAPELATGVWQHLKDSGIKTKRVQRGVDHGVWVPFKVMFPEDDPLDVPIIQVSTFHGYNLESQIRLGEAFNSLRNDYIISGSGMAVHSFASREQIERATSEGEKEAVTTKVLQESITLDEAIRVAVAKTGAEKRRGALSQLEALPDFRKSHPTVEASSLKVPTPIMTNMALQHFTPLLVAAGAAGDAQAEPSGHKVVEPGFSPFEMATQAQSGWQSRTPYRRQPLQTHFPVSAVTADNGKSLDASYKAYSVPESENLQDEILRHEIERNRKQVVVILTTEEERRIVKKADLLLLPLFSLMLTWMAVDRANIVLHRIEPHFWIPAQVIVWGLIEILQMLMKNASVWYTARLFLDLAEAASSRACTTIFFFGPSISAAFGSLISAGALNIRDKYGLAGWQWIFIICGVSKISSNRWLLSEREVDVFVARLLLDPLKGQASTTKITLHDFTSVLPNWTAWPYLIVCLSGLQAVGDLSTWGATIIEPLGFNSVCANLLNAPASLLASIFGVATGFSCGQDKAVWANRALCEAENLS